MCLNTKTIGQTIIIIIKPLSSYLISSYGDRQARRETGSVWSDEIEKRIHLQTLTRWGKSDLRNGLTPLHIYCQFMVYFWVKCNKDNYFWLLKWRLGLLLSNGVHSAYAKLGLCSGHLCSVVATIIYSSRLKEQYFYI